MEGEIGEALGTHFGDELGWLVVEDLQSADQEGVFLGLVVVDSQPEVDDATKDVWEIALAVNHLFFLDLQLSLQ